jgi:hypothetical protein
LVGPPLNNGWASASISPACSANTTDNMIIWLRNPQSVVPNNAMPNTGNRPTAGTRYRSLHIGLAARRRGLRNRTQEVDVTALVGRQ